MNPPSVKLGQITATPIVEIECLEFPPTMILDVLEPDALNRAAGWQDAAFYNRDTGGLRLSTHSWLLDTGAHKILVDPCIGNHKPRRVFPAYDMLNTPYLRRLAEAGARPEEIDFVFCTHLHVDHCGWNTQRVDGRWVPTFPNARYLFSRREHDFWRTHDTLETNGHDISLEVNVGLFADSVQPVMAAGLAQLLEDEPVIIADCLSIEPGYGHTIGHLIATLESGRSGAVFAGDALHHPVQIYHPDWNTNGSMDAVAARTTRRRLLERCADRGLLLAAAHFMAPHILRIERAGNAFQIGRP